MRKINRIIVHCSDSSFGDAATIDLWHKARGWARIGYHYVILNGSRKKGQHLPDLDGVIERGREDATVGAHAEGQNSDSLGICLISEGTGLPSPCQMATLALLVSRLCVKYSVTFDNVFGHNDFSTKACPGFNITVLRRLLCAT